MTERVDVLVLGGTIPGVVTALECAKLGLRVAIVFEELEFPSAPASGSSTDVATVTDAEGGWRWLVDELELGAQFSPMQGSERMRVLGASGQPVEVPELSVLGIPSSPLSTEVAAAVGQAGSFRAYLDRLKPVLTIGKEVFIAALVRKRMGKRVLDLLVTPFIADRFGEYPTAVDVALAVPGLNEAITRTGSLSTGVLAVHDAFKEREHTFALAGGWSSVAEAIHRKLAYWNVQVITANPAEVDPADGAKHLVSGFTGLVVACEPEQAERWMHVSEFGLTSITQRTYSDWKISLEWPAGLLASVEHPTLGLCSVRILESDGTSATVRVKQTRRTVPFSSFAEVGEIPTVTQITETLVSAGLEIANPPELVAAGTEIARWATLEEEHAHNGILQQLLERDTSRVVGDWLHQGVSSAAIMYAKEASQSLRRRLLGIT